MEKPSYSVVIATHNRPGLLRRALASIKQQSYAFQQVLVVSDVPDAASYAVANALLGVGDTFLQRSGAPGPAQSRNMAIPLVTADRLVFLDDDDVFKPHFLADVNQQFGAIQDDAIGYTNFEVVSADQSAAATAIDLAPFPQQQVWVKNFIPNNCVIYPRALLDHIRYDPQMAYEDWDFLLAAATRSPLVHLPIFGPVVHKKSEVNQVHRGEQNEDGAKLFQCYINIYTKYPPRTDQVARARRDLFASIGMEIDTLVANTVSAGQAA
jgi:glycosyltransferase involved in cell wall biosynthesis